MQVHRTLNLPLLGSKTGVHPCSYTGVLVVVGLVAHIWRGVIGATSPVIVEVMSLDKSYMRCNHQNKRVMIFSNPCNTVLNRPFS